MKQIAFLTMDSLEGYFSYDHLVIEPLRQRKCQVHNISWRAQDVDWRNFDLVIIRSPWDYQQAPQQFLSVLTQIEAAGTPLRNSLNIVRWNIDKRYLRDLQSHGIEIIPTIWAKQLTRSDLDRYLAEAPSGHLVCKPLIGAGAERTFWLKSDSAEATKEQVVAVYEQQPLMVQPFIRSVVDVGEYSLFYFGGSCSHSILKTPRSGDFRVQEEHGGQLLAVKPGADLLEAAEKTLAAIPEPTLYARVDLVRLDDGTPAVMELELIEPSLYFAHDATSPQRFAAVVAQFLRN